MAQVSLPEDERKLYPIKIKWMCGIKMVVQIVICTVI